MKRFFTLLVAIPTMTLSVALASDNLKLIESIYYERDSYIASSEEKAKLTELIDTMKVDTTFRVEIVGYGDKWGGDDINERFSYVRAMFIADYMQKKDVSIEQITYRGEGIDPVATTDTEARRVEILQVIETPAEVEVPAETPAEVEVIAETPAEVPAETQQSPSEVPAETPTETLEVPAESTPAPAQAQVKQPKVKQPKEKRVPIPTFNLQTNLLYDMVGLFNVGAEYRDLSTCWSILLNAGYSPFSSDDWENSLGGWFVSPEFRVYIPSNDHWFVGVQALYGSCNVKIFDNGREGDIFGAGVMGGYRKKLNENFDLDFTLGVGYTSLKYSKYNRVDGEKVYTYKSGNKKSFLPIQLGVVLVW